MSPGATCSAIFRPPRSRRSPLGRPTTLRPRRRSQEGVGAPSMALAGTNIGEAMRNLIAALLAACVVASPNGAQAIGCLTGAAAGAVAVAGHYAGHHAVLGAMAGC